MKKYSDRRKNPQWRKRWLDVVKYDQDWDWSYFMKIVMRKLELIKARWEDPKKTLLVEEDRLRMVKKVDELLKLGTEVLAESNEDLLEAHRVVRDHSHRAGTRMDDGSVSYYSVWEPKDGDPDGWKKEFLRLTKEGWERKRKALEDFFSGLGNNLYDLWD